VNHDVSVRGSFRDAPDFSQAAQDFGHQIRPMIIGIDGHHYTSNAAGWHAICMVNTSGPHLYQPHTPFSAVHDTQHHQWEIDYGDV
jgi:hypothetical protein